jgi:hypothetical protein
VREEVTIPSVENEQIESDERSGCAQRTERRGIASGLFTLRAWTFSET